MNELVSELRQSLQLLSETIQQSVSLLQRYEESFAGREPRRDAAERPSDGPLIPTRRSELLAKIDMRPARVRRYQ